MKLEQLQQEMIIAMKAGNKERKTIISNLIAQVKKAAIDKKCKDNITENLVNQVILKEEKTMQEMIDSCPKDRVEMLEKYNSQMAVIKELCPKLITDLNEIKKIIKENINDIPLNKGQIMRKISPILKGKADMKLVSQCVDKMLKGE